MEEFVDAGDRASHNLFDREVVLAFKELNAELERRGKET